MSNLLMARPALTPKQLAATRTRLTELALDLYLREGLEALSFRRLAEMAGVSHSLPHTYFEGKEGLLAAVRVTCTQRFERFVMSREQSEAEPLEQIRQIAMAYIEYVEAHMAEYQLIFTTHQPPPDVYPELLAARRSLFDHSVSVVQRAIDAGHLQGKALEVTHIFWTSLHGLMTLHVGNQLVHGMKLSELVAPLVQRMIAGAQHGASTQAKPSPLARTEKARRRLV